MKLKMKKIEIGGSLKLTIEDVMDVANRKAFVHLDPSSSFRNKINQGFQFIRKKLDKDGHIYGITTGYGENCIQPVPADLVDELPLQLSRFHGCGLGRTLSSEQARSVLVVRLNSLCSGFSGVSMELLEKLETLLHHDILPVIPEEGSVGASGDLTPMSYLVALLVGERSAIYRGQIFSSKEILEKKGIKAYHLKPKEALAIMNGTSVMTALAIEAYARADYLVKISARLTSITTLSLLGNKGHFDEVLFRAKPHKGQMKVAAYVRLDLENAPEKGEKDHIQDRYSTRCAPHVIGVLEDLLPTFRSLIETELNSANDNPLVDVEGEKILHGGHFYGGHIAFAMDGLKTLVANIADLLDRQMATLVDSKFNKGLPANLSGMQGERRVISHGLKALQIGASSWSAEALKGTMPASVFSRSTESHNQDKVSLGTIAARDALRVLDLTEQVVAAHMIATLQALRLREREGVLSKENYTGCLKNYIENIKNMIPFVEEDQPLDTVLHGLLVGIKSQSWSLYDDQ